MIFVAPEKAMGGNILLPHEFWNDVISGNSAIVIDDSITVTIHLCILDSTDGIVESTEIV
jgi:hypothetical protein